MNRAEVQGDVVDRPTGARRHDRVARHERHRSGETLDLEFERIAVFSVIH
jgi:hypothetical protein